MAIPHILLDRNPRNPDHINAAMELLGELGDIRVTERTIDELAKVGVKPPKNTRVWKKRIGKHETVIGGFFFLDQMLNYPDNVVVTCLDCRALLQIRPQFNTCATKLCVFCAVDRRLKDYWQSVSGADGH